MKSRTLSKLSIFTILAFTMVITSCKKTDTLVQVSVPLQMAQISYIIPMNQTSIDTTVTIYCNVDSIIRASNTNSFNISNIKSVTVTSTNTILTGITDASDNFGNLSSLYTAISSTSDTTATTFAQVTNNPGTFATSLNIPVNDTINLKNYFDATLFNYIFRSVLTTPTTIALQAQATVQFNIVVGPN